MFSAVKQNIHFCLIPSSEFLPALSQFPVREISGSFLETLCEVLGMFDLRFRLTAFEQNKQTTVQFIFGRQFEGLLYVSSKKNMTKPWRELVRKVSFRALRIAFCRTFLLHKIPCCLLISAHGRFRGTIAWTAALTSAPSVFRGSLRGNDPKWWLCDTPMTTHLMTSA